MLKNNELIQKLTIKQKIALLTGSHEAQDEIREQTSLSPLLATELWSREDNEGEPLFPPCASLANSWDSAIFGKSALCLAAIKAKTGKNFFIMPRANAASSVYGNEITEDPYLAGELISGAVKALEGAQAKICLTAPYVTAEEAQVLDIEADEFALFERVARPFVMAKCASNSNTLLVGKQNVNESYDRVNEKMLNSVVKESTVLVSRLEDGNSTVSEINKGFQVVGGSSLALEAAYENYIKIYKSMQEGGATAHELEMAVLDGAAISEEMIDIALDERITLLNECKTENLSLSDEEINETALDATRKSIVLVKNLSGALPISKQQKVCLIGDIISENEGGCYVDFANRLSQELAQDGITVTGYAQGYNLETDVSPEYINEAIKLASNSDTVLLFLGHGKEREEKMSQVKRLSLPANQVALASELSKLGKRVIAVVCSTRLPNVGFEKYVSGIILVPPSGAYTAQALAQTLSGKFNPSGRLAYAAYNNFDQLFRDTQARKRKKQQKIGPFIGYRYTDICKQVARYPFGYGLCYSSFTYSDLFVNGKKINFTVQNNTNVPATETIQVYVGMQGSVRVRAIKDLKATSKIFLNAYERKVISVNLADFEIYDSTSSTFVTETGNYQVFVGTSSSNILLSGYTYAYGSKLGPQKSQMTEYAQQGSNIISEGYTMEANCTPMNNISKYKTFSLWLYALTVFSDVIYGICGLMFGIPFKDNAGTFIALNAISLAVATICMVAYATANAKLIAEQKEKERKATRELFKDAEKIDLSSVEKLFIDEFDDEPARELEKKSKVTYKGEEESVYVYMSVDTDIPTLTSDLEKYCAQHGLLISNKDANAVIASMLSSRLLVLRNADNDVIEKFTNVLASFFGSKACVDDFFGRKSTSLLYNEEGSKTAFNLFFAESNDDITKPHFYMMKEAGFDSLEALLMPYVQFLGNPKQVYPVEENGAQHKIPSNLWFVLAPAGGQSIDEIPAFAANLAAVIDLDVQECAESDSEHVFKSVTCHQLEALVYRAKRAVSIDEQIWKNVDTLEEFVNEKTPYHIGNKIFLQLETYMSVYVVAGAEQAEAADGAISAKLLSAILAILKGNPAMSDVDMIQTLESIFGEDNVARCTKLLKNIVVGEAKIVIEEEPIEENQEDAQDNGIQYAEQFEEQTESVQYEEPETVVLDSNQEGEIDNDRQ